MRLVFGERPVTAEDVRAASAGGASVSVTPELLQRMRMARQTLDRFVVSNVPVYGLNTGMGANTGHRIAPDEVSAMQRDLILPRVASVGDPLSLETCRAALFCRLAGLAQGGAGISTPVFDQLRAMLERDVIPVIPRTGSIGASDLVQTASLAACAIGEGSAYFRGAIVNPGEALARAGSSPAVLQPKDGLSIASASSVTVAAAALAICQLEDLLAVHVAAAALACQGFAAHPQLFDERAAEARPAAGQVEAAARFREALDGGNYFKRAARSVQDAISFRSLPQVTGAMIAALAHARQETEIELNAPADNPLALGDSGEIVATANFLTNSLALAFDTLAIAVAHLATASVQRSIKLMTGRLSGLPNYLSPTGGVSAGFVPMQKTLAALHAEARLKAAPASLDAIVVSDMVEDIGANSALAVSKLTDQIALMQRIISIEAMLAAQSVDLRRLSGEEVLLSPRTADVFDRIRAATPMLAQDRATGPDAERVHFALWSADSVESLRRRSVRADQG